jgi:dTDP-glucose pyrophosphorylase
MSVVGVIPAAGYGTRLQPLHCSKEVYPVGGRPVMDYLVERMKAAPCDELRVVTRPEKEDVAENAAGHGAVVVEGHPASLGQSLATGMRGLGDDDVVLIGFPDSIWEPIDGYRRLLQALSPGWAVAVGLFRTPGSELRRYEPAIEDDRGRVVEIEFKPERASSQWIWGCAAATVQTLGGLGRFSEPGRALHQLARRGTVAGVRLSETYVDMGTRDGLRHAVALAASPPRSLARTPAAG